LKNIILFTALLLSVSQIVYANEAISIAKAPIQVPTAKQMEQLITAIKANKLIEVEEFIFACPALINAALNQDGQTPLIIACTQNNFEIIQFLVEYGARLDAESKNGDTQLRSNT
jgi:hypothetical protein